MDSKSLIALSAVVASTAITGLGLFLNYRERTAVFRHTLYSKQVEVAVAILNAYTGVRNRMIDLFDAQQDISEQDRVWHTVRHEVDALAAIASSAAALLPGSVYEAYISLHTKALNIMNRIAYDRLPKSELGVLDSAALHLRMRFAGSWAQMRCLNGTRKHLLRLPRKVLFGSCQCGCAMPQSLPPKNDSARPAGDV